MISYIGIFLLCFATANAFIFPENKTMIYEYHSIVKIGTTEPTHFESKFQIFAIAIATKIENGIYFQLEQIGYGELRNQVHIKPSALDYPFVFRPTNESEGGGISVDPKDEVWSVNIKRAIASLFLIDEETVNNLNETDMVVEGDEYSSFGKCWTSYTLLPDNNKNLRFSKRIYYTTCPGFVWSLDSSIFGNADDCGRSPNFMERAYMQRTYELDRNVDGSYLKYLRSDNNILHSVVKDEHFVVVDQRLELVHDLENQNIQDLKIDNMVIKPLEFEKQYETDGLYDLTGGRRRIDFLKIKNEVKEILFSVYNHVCFFKMDMADAYESENVIKLIEKLKQLDQENLYKLFIELEDSIKEIYIKILPLLGTKSSILTIHKLIKDKSVDVDIAVKMLQEIAFHVKKPEALFVENLMEFVRPESGYDKKIRNAAILSVSALLKSPPILFYDSKIVKADFSEHIDYFIAKLKNATEVEDRLVYMSALMNIQNNKVTDFLNSMIRNDSSDMELTPHLRSLAMFGTLMHMKNAWKMDDTWKREDVLPLFLDRNENFEVRSTALFMVLNYGSFRDILKLFWFMKTEKDLKLQRIFYTALESFSRSTNDCYKGKLKIVQNLIPYTQKPKVPLSIESSLNTYGYYDIIKKYGSSLNVAIFENQNDKKLKSMYIKYSFSLNDNTFDQHAIYVHEFNDTTFNVSDSSTPIEVIIFRNNIVVNSFVTTELEINRYIRSLGEFSDYPVTFSVHQNVGSELVVASDIGVPITLYMKKPILTEMQFKTKIEDMIMLNLTLNLWDRGEYGLKIYNPITDGWLGVRRVHSLDLKFQADLKQMSNDVYLKLMDGNSSPLGIKSSIYTEILIDDGKFERKMVLPDIKTIINKGMVWSYDDPNTGLVYNFEMAGCDFKSGAFEIDRIKSKFFIPDNRNWGGLILTKIAVVAQYVYDTISVFPGSRDCKVMMKIKRSENNPMTRYKITMKEKSEYDLPTRHNINFIFIGFNEDKIVRELELEWLKRKMGNGSETVDISIQNFFYGKSNTTIYVNTSRNVWVDGMNADWSIQKGLMTIPGFLDEVECSLNISMTGRLSEEQKRMPNLENDLYNKCVNNPVNKLRECAQKLTALRSYEYDISYNQKSMSVYLMKAFELLMGKHFKKLEKSEGSVEKGKMKLSMLYPLGTEIVDVSLIDDQQSIIIKDIPVDDFPIIGEPTNTFDFSSEISQKYCEFSVHNLWNLAHVHVNNFELESKWTRMVDNCPENVHCNLGIDAKRINQSEDLMALRVIVNKEILEVHIDDKVEMYVNDEPLVISKDSSYHTTTGTNIRMFADEPKVLIHVKNSKVNIEFTGNNARIALTYPDGHNQYCR